MYDYKKYNEQKYAEDYWVINRSPYKWFSNYTKLRIFKKFSRGIKNKKVFLDVGGGVGNWAFHFLKEFNKVIVLDVSKKALSKIPEKEITKLEGSATKIPLKNSSVDCILLADVLEHIHPRDLDKVVRELKRILAKEGEIIIYTSQYGYGIELTLHRLFNSMQGRLMKGEINEGHVNRMKFRELKQLFFKNGLEITNYYHYSIIFQQITDFIKDRLSSIIQEKNKNRIRKGQELKNKLKQKTGFLPKAIFSIFSGISYLDIILFGKLIPGSSIFLEIRHLK